MNCAEDFRTISRNNYPLVAEGKRRFFYSFTRVSIAIQFTSQVLPLSVENDCSNLQNSGLMSEMMKRTPNFASRLIRRSGCRRVNR